jgi:hypothetical protein
LEGVCEEGKKENIVRVALSSALLSHWAYAFRGSSSTRTHGGLGQVANDITALLNITFSGDVGHVFSALRETHLLSLVAGFTFAEPRAARCDG